MIEIISNEKYLTFKAPLLETNKVLETNRYYPKKLMEEAIERIMPRINDKTFVGELFSPPPKEASRHLTVLYREASHVIVGIEWDNDTIVGTIDTLNSDCGKVLRNRILDEIPIKFTLRFTADTRPKDDYDLVIGPLHIVTWDANYA